MRVVIDTNVLISGLISASGPPARVLDLWVEGAIQVAVSPPIISEYLGVFLRPKFEGAGSVAIRQETVQRMIDLPNTVLVLPSIRLAVIQEDQSDNRFLECAKTGQADWIISGDEHLLALGAFESIRIVTPRQSVEMLASL